ncbi:hypothetical protein ACL02U_14280 [Streptomyces sp. MS06]|uniref:hypothetical protein n=1 Tax=Streptomyces sp. MS06 TaxID=3385974 RepID=UPI00399FAE4C
MSPRTARTGTDLRHREHTMYEYDFHRARSAELIRRAEDERLAREAARGGRAARRALRRAAAARSGSEHHSRGSRRRWSTHTA